MPLLGPSGRPLNEEPPADAVPVNTTEPEAPAGPLPCITAFIVYQLPNGQWQVADDIDVPLVPERKPHFDDMTAGCSVTLRDIASHEIAVAAANLIVPNTANAVIQGQMAMGQKMAEQREAQLIAAKLEAEQKARRGGR